MRRANKLQVWLSDKEKEKLERLAQKEGVNTSEYIRKLIDRQPDPK